MMAKMVMTCVVLVLLAISFSGCRTARRKPGPPAETTEPAPPEARWIPLD